MKKLARWPFLAALLVAVSAYASVKMLGSDGSSTASVNTNGALEEVRGKSVRATYSCTATGLTTTSAYTMQLAAGSAKAIRIFKICTGTTSATAAALQTITVQRRTTASSGGTAATAEGTSSPAVSKFDPADSNFSGICTVTPTLGTAGAVLDGWGQMVGELGAGAADPPSLPVFCKSYFDMGYEKPIVIQAGTANGVSVSATAAGSGGLASGSITMMFTEE
jgi:hypothetical protein